jgi:hypothetical protein
MKTFWFGFITEVYYGSYNACWIQFYANLADEKDTSLLKCLCCEMPCVKKECLHIPHVEINTWKSTKNVNNSIQEWNSLLIPKHLNATLPLQMAEHTMKKLMLLLPVCTLVMTDETLLRNMQWKLIYCLIFVTFSNWWLTSKHSHY